MLILWVIVISVLAIIIILSFLCYLQRIWYFEDLKDVTRAFRWPLPILMDAIHFRNSQQLIGSLLYISKKNIKRCKISVGFDNYIIFPQSEDLKLILNSKELITKGKDYKIMDALIGGSLLVSTGKRFTQRKKILMPTVNMLILRDLVPTFEAVGDVLIEVLQEKSNESPIDVSKIFSLYTLDVVYETSLGVSINAQRNENNEYVAVTNNLMDIFVGFRTSWWKRIEFLQEYSSDCKKGYLLCEWSHRYIEKIIDQRRQTMTKLNGDLIETECVGKKFAFLDNLLNSTVEGVELSNEDIREELTAFMIAGRDTSTSTLSFSLHCLAQHPEIQEKLLREQWEIFGQLKDVHATYYDLQKMNYLEMVLKEVLRLYPSIPIFTREAKTNITTKFGTLKSGLQIFLSPLITHRNPEYFPEPERFDPERFSPENVDNIQPFTYLPFSNGYRNCIGNKFAMITLKSALSKIVRNFKIHPDLTYKPILVYEIVLRSKNGVRVILEKRV